MIRQAQPCDLAAINDLLREVLAVHHEGRPDLFHAEGKKYTDAEILSILANPLTPVFVYEEEGMVLGYAFCELQHKSSGSLRPVTTLYVDDFCVRQDARGRNIGRSLFEHLKVFAQEKGCYNITLHVWECNPAARAFYEAMGMSPQFTSMELIC